MSTNIPRDEPHTQTIPQVQNPSIPHLDLTRCYALIIGISTYAGSDDDKLNALPGASVDVDSMMTFLEGMKTPPDRIHRMRDHEATASAIRYELEEIAKKDTIEKDDPILIYFSGHGFKTKSVPSARVLCPYDFNSKITNTTSQQGVSTAELASLINNISSKKGNNITVIFDCCYSGEVIQGASEISTKQNTAFRVDSKRALDDELETVFEHLGVSSHVLLAGCGMTEAVLEKPEGGAYTNALLKILGSSQATRLTYRKLIESLGSEHLKDQHPQCIGINQNRYVFSTQTNSKRDCYRVNARSNGDNSKVIYTLNAGEASGITIGSKFSIHNEREPEAPVLGRLIVESITDNAAKLVAENSFKSTDNLPPANYAALMTCTNRAFNFFIADEQLHVLEDIKIVGKHQDIPLVLAKGPDDKHEASLIRREDNTFFEFHHKNFTKREEIPSCSVHCEVASPPASRDHIITVISGVADFYSHLDRTPSKDLQLSRDHENSLQLHCYQLEEYDDGKGTMEKKYTAKDLIKNRELELYGEESGPLGFEIVNDSELDLYVALFYFDFGDMSITSYYEPGTAKDGHVDFSIPRKGKLTIGYGSSGWRPRAFRLRKGHAVDVGVLKLFVSTRWVDFSDIKQTSPFTGYQRSSSHSQIYVLTKSPWGSIRVPVVHRRGILKRWKSQ